MHQQHPPEVPVCKKLFFVTSKLASAREVRGEGFKESEWVSE